jgi:hypothetical protein
MVRVLRRGTPVAVLRQFSSVFTSTGQNMSVHPNAKREALELRCSAPVWAQKLKPLFVLHHRLRRLAGGIYFQQPFSYAIYTLASPERRILHQVNEPTSRWKL